MKQRMVGTLVLGCLALIFIPLLLDGDGIRPAAETTTLTPPAPVIPQNNVVEPQRPQITSDLVRPSSEQIQERLEAEIPLPAVEIAESETLEDARRAFNEEGMPEAWSVRLGIFGDKSNADALSKRLINADYKAYSRAVNNSQGSYTGIFVGPMLTRSEANSMLRELKNKFNIEGIVVQFTVDDQ